MKHVTLQDAKARFGEVVTDAKEAPIVITRNGKEAAVLVPIQGQRGMRLVQGRRGATNLYNALRAAPGELRPGRLPGKFRTPDL